MTELSTYLRRTYPAQKRTDDTWEVRVDDRERDVAHEFCNIALVVGEDSTHFTLNLYPAPISAGLYENVESLGGTISVFQLGSSIELELSIKEVTKIRELAKEIRRVVKRGQRYPNPNWKWICRRTANSLDRLASNLVEFRRAKRHGLLEIASEEEEDEGLFAIVCTDETR